MKKLWENEKMRRLLMINAAPFALSILFYGLMDDLFLYLPILIWLTAQNYNNCEKMGQFLNMQTFLFICIITSLAAFCGLYMICYGFDGVSRAVFMLFLIIEVVAYIITTVVAAVMKWRSGRKSIGEADKSNVANFPRFRLHSRSQSAGWERMKGLWNNWKWVFLMLINVLPFVMNAVFYASGKQDDMFLFLPVLAGLTFLNYRQCDKTVPFVLLQTMLLLSIICSGYVSTDLYFRHISDDPMTRTIGDLFVFLESCASIGATIGAVMLKNEKNRRIQKTVKGSDDDIRNPS